MTDVRPDTHCGKVLAALSDGKSHTTRQLYREVGPMILHSRVADLRKRGYRIECDHIPGKGTGAGAYRYIWVDAPGVPSGGNGQAQMTITTDDIAPRVPAEQFRIFRVRNGGAPEILATVGNESEIWPAIRLMSEEGMLDDACLGVMDALDHQDANGKWVGKWLLLPYQKGM
jgi:hypothetical protein